MVSACKESGPCIGTNEFGEGSSVFADPHPQLSTFLRNDPKYPMKQVIPWTDTGLKTLGIPLIPGVPIEHNPGTLRLYIDGAWSPWGLSNTPDNITNHSCGYISCPTFDTEFTSTYGPNIAGCQKVDPDPTKVPCMVTQGQGLYGLISFGEDPNQATYVDGNYPSDKFRTFHVGSAPIQTDPDGLTYVQITQTQQCDQSGNCITDTAPDGTPVIHAGKLYFRILDNFYGDDSGGYNIKITSGVVSDKGWIQRSVEGMFQNLLNVSASLMQKVTVESPFISIIRALLVLYIAINGLFFMLGLIKYNVGELVTRLVKVGIVATLIAPNSFEFFYNNFFIFFTEGANSIAKIIIETTLYFNADPSAPRFPMPPDANALSVFDVFLRMIEKPALHAKILATASTIFEGQADFVFIPLMYIAISFVVIAALKALVMYLMSLIFIAILIALAPIFIAMILFQLTFQLFKQWLDMLIANALLIILISGVIGLMVLLVIGQLEALLSYKICWLPLFNPSYIPFEIDGYKPADTTQMRAALNYPAYFTFLISAIVFNGFMGFIPQMVDGISGSALQPASSAYREGWGRIGREVSRASAYARGAMSAPLYLAGEEAKKLGGKIIGDKGRAALTKFADNFKESAIGGAITKVASHIPTSAADVEKGFDKIEKTFGNAGDEQNLINYSAGDALKKGAEVTKEGLSKGAGAVKSAASWTKRKLF